MTSKIGPREQALRDMRASSHKIGSKPAAVTPPAALNGAEIVGVYGTNREAREALQPLNAARKAGESFATRRTQDGRWEIIRFVLSSAPAGITQEEKTHENASKRKIGKDRRKGRQVPKTDRPQGGAGKRSKGRRPGKASRRGS